MRDHGKEMTMVAKDPMRRRAARTAPMAFAALCVALLLSLVASGAARADFGFDGPFVGTVSTLQAGAHPDARTAFALNANPDGSPQGNLKEVHVDLPAGLVGNPQAIPQCPMSALDVDGVMGFLSSPQCPADTMVGTVTLTFTPGAFLVDEVVLPVFNIAPQKGEPAAFAFQAIGYGIVRLDASVRSGGDYGLSVDIHNITEQAPVVSTDLTLWGVPADHNGPGSDTFTLVNMLNGGLTYGGPGSAPRVAFMTNPVQCGVSDAPTISASSWQDPSHMVGPAQASLQQVTGCEKLQFEPTIKLRPDNTRAGSPAGVNVDLAVPQNNNPDGLATPPLKDATVVLPKGMAISPSAADGLQGCTDDQVGLSNGDDPNCPAASTIGKVSVDTPLLASPLTGSIYLGQPESNDSSTGKMFRVFLVLQGSGVTLKLEGDISPDAKNGGQLTAVFKNNPQLPFSALHLRFQGGPRATLTTPTTCGTYTTTTSMTSWDPELAAATPSDSFVVDKNADGTPCSAAGFSPTFSAGSRNTAAGKDTAFSLTFGRRDVDQNLSGLTVSLPQGLLGRISAVPQCPEGAAAAGTCDAVSQVGTATTGAGPGSNPFFLGGKVYLTGPYKGAPFGLSIVVPALAGPFDLGTVVVRTAINVDPTTAAITVVSDPLPTMLQGVPLQIRTVNVTLDRSGFMFNPSSCNPTSVNGTLTSTEGATRNVSSRFQVGGCASLKYTPKLSISVGRKGRTSRAKHLPFTAVLTQPVGQANNRTVQTTLPATINSRIASLKDQCAMADFLAEKCSKGSQVGTASAITPVLSAPLTGGVFFVKNPKGGLPTMWIDLKGEGVRLNVRGDISIPQSKYLRVRITSPDAPVTRFRLSLTDGPNAPLSVAASSLCTAKSKADPVSLAFRAQNGKLVQVSQRLHIAGCASAKAK